ncbi:hypothetical protein D0C27_11015 [Alcaligenes faecalis]|uniref:hypothetical protein n=1 Tax=Alcaligenes faecalis TaxID=511 RepID=UPI0010CA2E95|nr:hypothetical protein [Alcaligenes faecalis]QCP82381.1 hypothetical protein D0C27_11015 [Alcaligenes faecalis]
MNANAEREVCAYELAERRREVIAQQIKDCLIGKSQAVLMSWGYPTPANLKSRADLLEVLNDQMIAYEKSDAIGPFVKSVLNHDPVYRDGLNAHLIALIQSWADASHDAMTAQELEALPC